MRHTNRAQLRYNDPGFQQEQDMKTLGVIRHLARYPVKSMQGESLSSLPLTLQGFEEDRRYAFVQAESRSAFPWLTAREFPELLRWQTSVDKPGTPDVTVTVTTASGARWPVASDELLKAVEEGAGKRAYLLRDYRGSYDVAAVSLISAQTVQRIAEVTGISANPWRFRPNVVADLEGGAAFDELKWVGMVLCLGAKARIAITQVDERCVMTNLDPETIESNPQVLKCIVQQHAKCAGIYASVLTPGEVRVGDSIQLEP